MTDLFQFAQGMSDNSWQPLAERMRPQSLEEVIGQGAILGAGKPLRIMIEQDQCLSMIFWGPAGTGKTSIARLIARLTTSSFIELSAVESGVPEIREVIQRAKDRRFLHQEKTIVFIDEIHRLTKSQQDALLPAVEKGIIILIGATTENPGFEVNRALLSRSRIFIFERLTPTDIVIAIKRAIHRLENEGKIVEMTDACLDIIADIADGDVRQAYTILEMLISSTIPNAQGKRLITEDQIIALKGSVLLHYDKGGDQHYQLISALHKSIRGNDADASIYWLARMLESGADPLYIARRCIRIAAEDIGLADPQALVLATSVFTACHAMGLPECNVILAEVVGYLARAPKSIEVYAAYSNVVKEVSETKSLPVPLHLRNPSNAVTKEQGYGKGYKYTPEDDSEQDFLPEGLIHRRFW